MREPRDSFWGVRRERQRQGAERRVGMGWDVAFEARWGKDGMETANRFPFEGEEITIHLCVISVAGTSFFGSK